MQISACIITCNEEQNLARCLGSLASSVDEIVVVDSGSTDATEQIAHQFGARFSRQEWLGYVGQKNFALSQAAFPWVLSIDADEELSPELVQAIRELRRPSQDGNREQPNGYTVSRVVYYRGKWIRHGDWYPDRLVRLFRRADARFCGGRVHERLEIAGMHPLLAGDLRHYTYATAADRARRCEKYAQLWADSAWADGHRAAPGTGAVHAAGRFLRGFVLKAGFLDGAVGFDIAYGNAREVALKYRLLRQLRRAHGHAPCP